jgi:hypothetical protein
VHQKLARRKQMNTVVCRKPLQRASPSFQTIYPAYKNTTIITRSFLSKAFWLRSLLIIVRSKNETDAHYRERRPETAPLTLLFCLFPPLILEATKRLPFPRSFFAQVVECCGKKNNNNNNNRDLKTCTKTIGRPNL